MSTQHRKYVEQLTSHLTRWLRRKSRPILQKWVDAALVLMHLDLELAREILAPLYSDNPRGREPYNPICMLRALLLLHLLQIESIPQFAQQIKTYPRLAKICGFFDAVPACSTFYLFIDRLEDGAYQPKPLRGALPSSQRKGRHLRNLSLEKQQRKENREKTIAKTDSVTEALSEQLTAGESDPRPNHLQQWLEDLLCRCAIIPSAQLGLLGDLEALVVAGDGSALESAANPNGQPSCDCRSRGIYRCDCDRYYSDPTADWGYNSHRDCYYFGHTFYQHVISSEGYDLPIHVGIGPASETDATLSLKSLDRLKKMWRENGVEAKISHLIYDAGHDATGIYKHLIKQSISPIIPLKVPLTNPQVNGTAQSVNDDGVPLCPASLPMRWHTYVKSKGRTYYNCPVKRPTHRQGEKKWIIHDQECPLAELCQPDTKMGPVVYLNNDEDSRRFPPLPRDSDKYKRLMRLRSGCERSNSQKKETYRLARRVCRNQTHYLVRLYLISIIEHAKAWQRQNIKQFGRSIENQVRGIFSLL